MITVTHPQFPHITEEIEDDQLDAYKAQGWLPPKEAEKAAKVIEKADEKAAKTDDTVVKRV